MQTKTLRISWAQVSLEVASSKQTPWEMQTLSSSWSKLTGISFLIIFPNIVSPPGWAVCAFAVSSAMLAHLTALAKDRGSVNWHTAPIGQDAHASCQRERWLVDLSTLPLRPDTTSSRQDGVSFEGEGYSRCVYLYNNALQTAPFQFPLLD